MTATVRLAEHLRAAAGGAQSVEVAAGPVGAILAELVQRFPGMSGRLTDSSGLVRHLNVYVRGRDVRFGAGLAEAAADGDVVLLLAVGAP